MLSSPNDAIRSILSSKRPLARDIIRLAMWIRFSGSVAAYHSACVAASAAYIKDRHPDIAGRYLSSREFLDLIIDIFSTEDILSYYGTECVVPNLEFDFYPEYPTFYSHTEIADAVHFMLWYKPKTNDKRKQASLGRAHWYISRFGFIGRGKSSNSDKVFLKLFSKNINSLGLIYAAEYLLDEEWILNPLQQGFSAGIDRLCDRGGVLRLLSNAKAVDRELDRILHRRTRERIARADIPETVAVAELEAVTLRPEVYEAMVEYEPNAGLDDDDGCNFPRQLW